mmetsp:Transcript_14538/g.24810  ORF Transcript_14538/g.24810 Transcript_14538/m.24810 type:complete len:157 (+) Transcript_14538:493-963(+)
MLSFKDFPYPQHAPQLKEYILVLMGFHFGGMFTHFFGTRRNDFIEMGLHHIVSIYLFGGGYMFNALEIGSTIAFLHDIADITTSIVKVLAETHLSNATAVVFVTHMGIWFWTRILVLPYLIFLLYFRMGVNFGSPIVTPFFCYLLGCMFILHCYWF